MAEHRRVEMWILVVYCVLLSAVCETRGSDGGFANADTRDKSRRDVGSNARVDVDANNKAIDQNSFDRRPGGGDGLAPPVGGLQPNFKKNPEVNVGVNRGDGLGAIPAIPKAYVPNKQESPDGNANYRREASPTKQIMYQAPQPGAGQRQPDQEGGAHKTAIKVAENPNCVADVKRLCEGKYTNNFAVMECLQSDSKGDYDVSKGCQHFLYMYKKNLTMDMRFESAASEVCKESYKLLPACSVLPQGTGQVIPCLVDNLKNITNPNCRQFLKKMEGIIFSDYRLIYKFTDTCHDDIERLECGRLHPLHDTSPHTQGKTVECLSDHVKELDPACKHEILRIAELQSEDYHSIRPLYYACREDRERFCKRTKAGNGKVIKCLLRHKFERGMSTECRQELVLVQKLTQEDYKVNRGLAQTCHEDILSLNCLQGNLPDMRQGKLSYILLCLEGAQMEGKKVAPECIAEVQDMRRSLMEDYKISPDIVANCSLEIQRHCGGGLEREGKTLHCLMDLVRLSRKNHDNKINVQCHLALKSLLQEAQPGEDYRMDPALQTACQPVVDTACKSVKPGDARVIGCLMEKIGTNHMNDECEEKLMEIQYFVARDFKLDTRLYKYCNKDAKEKCHAPKKWFHPEGDTTPDQGPLVFSCLYRHLKSYSKDPNRQLARACAFEVRRTMHQRAIAVELEPNIEEPCMTELATLCSEDTEKGEEMECLQDHFEELDKDCQMAVGNYTEDVDEDPELDRVLMKACTPMIQQFCKEMLEGDLAEPGDVMECLIKHKHHIDMNRKCAAGIEHHQLITLEDYHFSFKFKESCKQDVLQNCHGIRKKSDVIKCLSEFVRNDTLLDDEHRLSKPCRRQLRFELLQKGEDIRLNPDMKRSCDFDIKQHCNNVSPGNAAVLECLKNHQKELSSECHEHVFKREKLEAVDTGIDYLLVTACKRMILQHCSDGLPSSLMKCLQEHKDELDFDGKCRKVVLSRMETRNLDYRLNPELTKSCKMDINKFCQEAMAGQSKKKELEGTVLQCLKVHFLKKRLSRDCEEHISDVIKEAALDYKQDPVLAMACKDEIKKKKVPTATLR